MSLLGRFPAAVALVALAGPVPLPVLAQTPTPQFKTGSEVVVLDVVVRDRKGRTVRDLRPDEITVLEDGVPQDVLSFRLRAASAEEAEPREQGPAATAAEPPGAPV